MNIILEKGKLEAQTSQAHVQIVVTHGFHVDNMIDEALGPPEHWCGYCAITSIKFTANGKMTHLLNASDGHVKTRE